ncbi:hypothetical protein ACTJIL_13020 [Luteimonas sp. 22616]|jgi:hypothetical protein|uniref:hypothetical protein n=1 Tax=Luteimonas sp. 22616 TaxID=3453951 RepID=UPI003F8337E4
MNTTLRNSLLAMAVVGALSLAACKTTDDSMDAPEPAPAPAEPMDDTAPPMDDTMPTDPTTTPTDATSDGAAAPTTP